MSQKRILIADYDNDNREKKKMMLENKLYKVMTFSRFD